MIKQLSLPFLLFAFFVILFSCNRTSKEITKEVEIINTPKRENKQPIKAPIPREDFNTFYNKFHDDSVFQIDRVKFPLKGYAMDTSESQLAWEKNSWVMHRNTIQDIDTSQFKINVEKTEYLYKEKVFIEGGGFASERIFKQINGKWYLVSFIDVDL